ncbi:MAG: tetratricopeptide repeat protein [Flavobacteriales bacterium]|nr:tetratricopeptide repeat protein [Flavobacteriales bacterium]
MKLFYHIKEGILLLLILVSTVAFSQDSELLKKYKQQFSVAKHDTARIRILIDLVDNTYDHAIWPKYNDQVLEIAGNNLPNNDEQQEFIFKVNKGYALNNKGFQVEYEGNRILALTYYQESLALHRSIDWQKGVSACLNNIGSMLYDQEEYERAMEYYMESISIKKELGYERGLAWTYLNVGSVAEKLKQNDSAYAYYQRAYDLNKKLDAWNGIAAVAHNMGTMLSKVWGDRKAAMNKYRESLANYKKDNDTNGMSWELGVIGLNLFRDGDIDSGLFYNHKALKLAELNQYQDGISSASSNLALMYESVGDYKNAFEYKLMEVKANDTLLSNKVRHEVLKTEMQFVHNQEKLEMEKEQEKKELISQAKHKQQQIIIISVLVGLFAVVGFLIVLLQRFKKEKQQKLEIEKQRDEIEEKNTEIIDSITYAERIQHAILKSKEYESKHLPAHFIFFKPKDIVSGDFYWAKELGDVLYLSVADCTGHGVPGALMSMLGISLLNDIVNDNNDISPAEMLDRLRDRIIKELSQSEDEDASKEGMDISLIKINLKTRKIEWAGANNPLWIARNNADEMEEIKPDKQPIAYYDKMDPFTNNSVQLQQGDSFYLFSDGYPDQFGGLKGKKLKSNAFKDLLLKNAGEEMQMQKLLLSKFFENWKGEIGQIDDVCIIGVRM